jgi:S-adenosylmethionine:tRNA ribosyltransferase-isomerase
MELSAFDYELPQESIAQEGASPRDAARLLVLRRAEGSIEHRHVRDLPDLLSPGDLVLLNDARVVAARLIGHKSTGGRVELLLLEPLHAIDASDAGSGSRWRALVGASRVPRPGSAIDLGGGFSASIESAPGRDGAAIVNLEGPGGVAQLIERRGRPPLPPYIRRGDDDPRLAADRERYQTTFARVPGAVAAPTAGLHFTPELLARLEGCAIRHAFVTLRVGEGTFQPLRVERTEDVELHSERYEVPRMTATAIRETRRAGGRVVAVGTTVVRALESRDDEGEGVPSPGAGQTRLCITPGFRFRFVDALLTNFHLPRSSLLMLVCAFAGRDGTLAAYRDALSAGYRFYSYGDAMLVLS